MGIRQMTTIAFDGTTLAADKQATHNNTPVPYTKLFRIEFRGEPAWVGCAGTIEKWSQVLDWMRLGGDPPEMEEKDFSVLVVTKSKKAYYANDSFFFHDMGRHPWAIGSGSDYALGAMAHGASAKEAVEIASSLDVNTGLGVEVVQPGRL